MKNLLLSAAFATAVCAPVFAADLDELLPPRLEAPVQESPASVEAPAPRPSRIPGMPQGRGRGGPREEARREQGPGDERPPMDPEFKEKLAAIRAAEEKVHAVAQKLRAGSEVERSSARTEARKLLGELFDAKLELQEFELSRLEERAAELKAKIARKKLSREKAVDERLAKMGGDDDWD